MAGPSILLRILHLFRPYIYIAKKAGPNWSDLPSDLLLSILQRLELPGSLAFAAVCASWRSAAATAGVLPCRAACLMTWGNLRKERLNPVSSEFRNLLDVDKAYEVSFPQGRFPRCCASHGWLIAADELSNLVMYNPFTLAMIHLPPITDFSCVEAVYGSEGNIKGYLLENTAFVDVDFLGKYFYQKVALSCTPSLGGKYIAMVIHRDRDWLSFARAGEGQWRVVSTLTRREDHYTDCVYHNGRFYTVTVHGVVDMWDVDGMHEPKKEAIIMKGDWPKRTHRSGYPTVTRFLVSTPWGDLLQVHAILAPKGDKMYPKCLRIDIGRINVEGHKVVALEPETALREHAVFLGQNHSACLPANKFAELRPNCIYFTVPWLTNVEIFECRRHGWRSVRIYDLKNQTLVELFPPGLREYATELVPSEVWITPNL